MTEAPSLNSARVRRVSLRNTRSAISERDAESVTEASRSQFANAIAYPQPCPVRPDRIAVAALDGETIMGMAGCSEDAPHWQQIGIDILPEYRSRGIGAYLVTLLKNRIIEMGDVPFYGTDAANIRSQNVAISSGFKPAWVETEAWKIERD